MNKFLNVDVIDTLSKISDQITLGTYGLSRGNIDEIYQMVKMQAEGGSVQTSS